MNDINIRLEKINKTNDILLEKRKKRIIKREIFLQNSSLDNYKHTPSKVNKNLFTHQRNKSNGNELAKTSKLSFDNYILEKEYKLPYILSSPNYIKQNSNHHTNSIIHNKININENNSFNRMKKYKVNHLNLRKISYKIKENNNEEELKKLFTGTGLNLNTTPRDNKDNKKKDNEKINSVPLMKFNEYIKLQTKADYRLRPKIGDLSYDLLKYIKTIKSVRINLINNIINDLDKTENRYNDERPFEDTNIKLSSQYLAQNRWKNVFKLNDYQKFFLDRLHGKISQLNYREMQRIFAKINQITFAKGNTNYSLNEHIDNLEY